MFKSGDNIKKHAHDFGQMRQLSLKVLIMSLSHKRFGDTCPKTNWAEHRDKQFWHLSQIALNQKSRRIA